LRVHNPPAAIDHQIARRDEWRAAKLLIRRHGDRAQIEATCIANLVGCGDDWKSRWARIRRAIEVLQLPRQDNPP
jgi:hypothetical protein